MQKTMHLCTANIVGFVGWIVGWILEAWSEIPGNMIICSFKKTGISNSLDGTEDDALWADDGEAASDVSEESDDSSCRVRARTNGRLVTRTKKIGCTYVAYSLLLKSL